MTEQERYALSFTSGGLFSNEAQQTLEVWLRLNDWDAVRSELMDANTLQLRTVQSRRTVTREVVGRLAELNMGELEILGDASPTERLHLMWVAACRRYDLIGEFAEEVLRERFLTLAGKVSPADYDSFYRAKAMWHDELLSVSVNTYKKLRQVLFKMLVEAGLLTAERAIEPALLSARVTERLNERTPSDIRFFPTRMA